MRRGPHGVHAAKPSAAPLQKVRPNRVAKDTIFLQYYA